MIVERKIKFKLLLSLSKHSKNVKSDIINSNYFIVHTEKNKNDFQAYEGILTTQCKKISKEFTRSHERALEPVTHFNPT